MVAPASITACKTSARYSLSVRIPSSAENSTSSQADLASFTPFTAWRITSSGVILSFRSRWIGLVAMKVWIRAFSAGSIASIVRSMSRGIVRHRPAITGPRISVAIARTASKSPGDAAGKPASMISTFISASTLATRSFCPRLILKPGLCSPSLKVVSNILIMRLIYFSL